jgi:uncharacterized protein
MDGTGDDEIPAAWARRVGETGAVQVEIYVRPGASATRVGGVYDGAVVVRVVEPADRGRATEAALMAMAGALGLPRRSIALVRGGTSRSKLIDVEVGASESEGVGDALAQLRAR